MSNELAVRNGSTLAIAGDQTEFTPQQVAALAQLGVEHATDGDLAVFFHQSQRTGLDPFAKQIYMIGRNGKKKDDRGQWHEATTYTIQTGIDGYRLVARRAADSRRETLGYEDTQWCGTDGVWRDVWLSANHPAAARVVILRNGQRFPAVALWDEYVQTKKDYKTQAIEPNAMWSKMGAGQLAKCAEALALRKAFPQDLSGLYVSEEMGQADNEPATPPRHEPKQEAPASNAVSPAQLGKLGALLRESQVTKDEALAFYLSVTGREVTSTKELTKQEASKVIDAFEAATAAAADVLTGEVVDAEIVDSEWPAVTVNGETK